MCVAINGCLKMMAKMTIWLAIHYIIKNLICVICENHFTVKQSNSRWLSRFWLIHLEVMSKHQMVTSPKQPIILLLMLFLINKSSNLIREMIPKRYSLFFSNSIKIVLIFISSKKMCSFFSEEFNEACFHIRYICIIY